MTNKENDVDEAKFNIEEKASNFASGQRNLKLRRTINSAIKHKDSFEDQKTSLLSDSHEISAPSSEMAPRPDGDLFIEPAGDYDVVYGDYNSTMDDGNGKRPYLRLTSRLSNMTRSVGEEVRLKCEVAGSPLPVTFTWLKNLAPLEKNSRVRIKNKDNLSKLTISKIDVLDSGYYQCTANNTAGSVNTTAVLKVNLSKPVASSSSGFSSAGSAKGIGKSGSFKNNEFGIDDFYYNGGDADEMKSEDNALFDVPNSSAGAGFAPVAYDRWLEDRTLRKGECVLYKGPSCSEFLAGKHVKINSENREDIYDIDRHLTAAILFIRNMPNVSDKCKRYSHAVACYHLFKVCDRPPLTSAGYESSIHAGSSNDVISVCKKDCDKLQSVECPNEFALADHHGLIGEGEKVLLPRCGDLPDDAPKCIRVLEPAASMSFPSNNKNPKLPSIVHCYDGDGRNYEGTISKTKSQRQCLTWPSHTSTLFNTHVYPRLKSAKNYCRNPEGRRDEPFCYTEPLNSASGAVLVEEACDIPRCQSGGMYHPSTDVYRPTGEVNRGGSAQTPLLESLANVWHSLSAEQLQLFAALGIGALGLLFVVLLCWICCCCCRWGGGGRRRKSSTVGSGAIGSSSGVNAVESSSSMISGVKKNGNFIRISGAGSSAGNSDVNNAFFQKMREERIRHGCGDSDALNPLLNPADQYMQQQQQQPKQVFQLQQQSYRWVGNESMGAGSLTGSLQYPYPPSSTQMHHTLLHASLPLHQQQQFPYAPQLQQQQPQQQQFMVNEGSPHTSTEPPAEPYQIPTIQEHQLRFDEERSLIGEDATTKLFQGEWTGSLISGNTLHVVIKMLKLGVNKMAADNFRDEIKEVGPLEHINVLRMYGVVYLSQQNISAVFDYMIHGDLHEFLKVREPRCSTNKSDEDEHMQNAEDFLRICTQIIAGMEYLASFGYVHRDLATRNCLVADQQIVKICDFARLKSNYDADYYRINQGIKVPLRWLSREAFNENIYSQASDVYAFGVTLWEVYTYGRQPYDNFSDQQVIDMLNDDLTLDAPQFCPPIIYSVIMNCTNTDPKRRPTFAELHPRFQKWCSTGQSQALLPGGRASSVHSGSSGSAAMQRACRQLAPPVSSYTSSTTNNSGPSLRGLMSGGIMGSDGQFAFTGSNGGSVPSPAPNANASAQMTKLTMLSNAANSVVRSTPIGHNIDGNAKLLNDNFISSEYDDYSSNDS